MNDLTAFQRDILYVLAGLEEPKGLTVKRQLEEYYQQQINHGRLYPNLDTLVENELIEKGEQDGRTNYYQLTPAGTEEIRTRERWEKQFTGVNDELAATADD